MDAPAHSPTAAPHVKHCGERAARAASIPLPLLASSAPKVRRSRSGPRRAGVLILVHVVFAIHIAQWMYAGMTLSPVEPSESMYTLERGLLNAGFVFFALAILSTLVFGRVFCGWGCHVVALQDLCGWMMKRVGVHPKPFRTRLLILAPLGLAIYMFVWPTLRRELIQPAFTASGAAMPLWIGPPADRPALHPEFFVPDFWATFPAWYVAIPFLGVCGFATVYFLGAKGFCTYGCPYGGFFGPADTVAVGRILVNDDCEHCGHCTAVCTSNVRVHEEVRDYGMVVDPGCMKCMDCVSVCPNGALRFGFAPPPMFNARAKAGRKAVKRQRPYDLSRAGEVVLAALFVALLLGFRGFLDQVPLLMAAGLAGIGSFAAWKLWCMARVPNVRLQNLQLRYRGRWTRAGLAFAPAAAALLLAGAWGIVVRYHLWRGGLLDSGVRLAAAEYLAPGFAPPEADRARAETAIAHLRRAGPPGDGGIGWARSADVNTRLASLSAIVGRFDDADRFARRAIDQREPTDEFLRYAAALLARRGAAPEEFEGFYRSVLARHPRQAGAHVAVAGVELAQGNTTEAARLAERAVALGSTDPAILAAAGSLLMGLERWGPAISAFGKAIELDASSGVLRGERALALHFAGRTTDAVTEIAEAVEREPNNPALLLRRVELLRAAGHDAEAEAAQTKLDDLLQQGRPEHR
ncbi:MAG: 4Fe-4S binding protein [Phycisphaerales bacterium]